MITYIKINGFKSFQNFEMEFAPFTVIAGTNASGKSNLFDAIKVLSRLAEVDIKTAFAEQRGSATEIFTQYAQDWYAQEIAITVELLLNNKITDNWGGEVKLKNLRLRYSITIIKKKNILDTDDFFIKYECLENIHTNEDKWIQKYLDSESILYQKHNNTDSTNESFIKTEGENKITIKMKDGKSTSKPMLADTILQTVLSSVNKVETPHILAAKEEMKSWHLWQPNPEHLQHPTRQEPGMSNTMTWNGKNMASALYRLKQEDEYNMIEISRQINSFIPNFISVNVEDDKANKQYIIKLKERDGNEYTSRVVSEGTLRILALCILGYDNKNTGVLCFEEPENGIHPNKIKFIVALLNNLATNIGNTNPSNLKQVIINTHSPVLVSEVMKLKKDNGIANEGKVKNNIALYFSQIRTLLT